MSENMTVYDSFKEIEKDLFDSGWRGKETSVVGAPRLLLELAGELDTAIFLNQAFMYTCSAQKNNRAGGYFYKSSNSWQQSIKIKRTRLERIISALEQDGLLETEVRRVNNSNTRHYRVNHYELWRQIKELCEGRGIDIPKELNGHDPPWVEELDEEEDF